MRPRPKVKRVTGIVVKQRAEPVVDIGGQAAEVIDHGPVGDVMVGDWNGCDRSRRFRADGWSLVAVHRLCGRRGRSRTRRKRRIGLEMCAEGGTTIRAVGART